MEAAIAGFDAADAEAEEDPPDGAKTEAGGQEHQLQRAGLQQRLLDLQAKQQRVQGALEVNQGGGKAAEGQAGKASTVALLEDGGLDEELNAAGNSAMVETERDRLIRLVRAAHQAQQCVCSTFLVVVWDSAAVIAPVGACQSTAATSACLVQGVLTPFDRLDGYERRVQQRPAQGAAARSAGEASTSGGVPCSLPLPSLPRQCVVHSQS